MKESYSEDLASHSGPELYADDGNVVGVATTGVHAGQPLSSEITCLVRRRSAAIGRQYRTFRHGKTRSGTTESENLSMRGSSKRENREILLVSISRVVISLRGGTVRKRLRRYC
jgi:hypothetical protein